MTLLQYASFLLIPWMSWMASMSGGNNGAVWLVQTIGTKFGAKAGKFASNIPEILWALTIAAVTTAVFHGSVWNFLFFAVWSYTFMQIGHGNAFHDGMAQHAAKDRWQSLDYIIRPIFCRWRLTWAVDDGHEFSFFKNEGFEPRSTWYCRAFMALKGFLIGFPMLAYGLPLIVLWPFGYCLGFRILKSDSYYAELFTGGAAGACLVAAALSAG